MSFAITRRISPPPPYDNQVSNALNLNIFAITALIKADQKKKYKISHKSGNIKFQCSAREIFLLDVPHENCNGTEKELGAKSAQMFYYECKGHFTLHRKTNIS